MTIAIMGSSFPTGLKIHATDLKAHVPRSAVRQSHRQPLVAIQSRDNGRPQPHLPRQHLRQRDEEMWDEALDFSMEKLPRNEWFKGEGGVNKIRMVVDVAIVKKGGL